MDDLIFPDHALERMRQRGISTDDASLTVEDPDEVIVRDDLRSEYSRMMDDGREILVVIETMARAGPSSRSGTGSEGGPDDDEAHLRSAR